MAGASAGSPGTTGTPDLRRTLRSKGFRKLLIFAALAGFVVSIASWVFLEAVHETQHAVFRALPAALGLHPTPSWWPLPFVCLAGIPVAYAITRLPGNGGHVPVHGLGTGPTGPRDLPGVLLAAFASLTLGLVMGPEAPLIALGSGLALLAVRLVDREAPDQLGMVLAASGSFAALSFVFGSPIIAAVVMIEAVGLGGASSSLVLLPGLLSAGIGSLTFIGVGWWTGLNTSAFALSALALPKFLRPTLADFGWSIMLAVVGAVLVVLILRIARSTERIVTSRPFLLLPAAGVVVGVLALVFATVTDKGPDEVLFSGQDQLTPLVEHAASWSHAALALVIVLKGLAWAVCLGSFRGGPTFPAIFIGAAGGLLAGHLPGFSMAPAVAVGIGVMVVAVLRLPLSAIILAELLTRQSGLGVSPLVIVAVVITYLLVVALTPPRSPADGKEPSTAESPSTR